jgi:hypothetical protein
MFVHGEKFKELRGFYMKGLFAESLDQGYNSLRMMLKLKELTERSIT